MVAFLLLFTDEETAFWLFVHLVENILGASFYEKSNKGNSLSGYATEVAVLGKLASATFMLAEEEQEVVQNFLNMYGPILLIPLSVNFLTFEVTCHIWNELFLAKSLLPLDRVTLALIKIVMDDAREDSTPRNSAELVDFFQKHVTWSQILIEMDKIPINEEERHLCRQQFLADQSAQWIVSDNLKMHRLAKITKFRKDEIEGIQNEFSKIVNIETEGNVRKVGLSKEEFSEIMTALMENTGLKERLSFLKYCSMDKLYQVLDEDNTNQLDFREVLWALSVICRGTAKEKISLLFYMFDNGNKNCLDFKEFEDCITCLSDILLKPGVDEINTTEADVEAFKVRVMEQFQNKKEITLSEIHEIRKDEMFLQLEKLEKTPQRRNTAMSLAQILQTNHMKMMEKKSSPRKDKGDGNISSGDEENGHQTTQSDRKQSKDSSKKGSDHLEISTPPVKIEELTSPVIEPKAEDTAEMNEEQKTMTEPTATHQEDSHLQQPDQEPANEPVKESPQEKEDSTVKVEAETFQETEQKTEEENVSPSEKPEDDERFLSIATVSNGGMFVSAREMPSESSRFSNIGTKETRFSPKEETMQSFKTVNTIPEKIEEMPRESVAVNDGDMFFSAKMYHMDDRRITEQLAKDTRITQNEHSLRETTSKPKEEEHKNSTVPVPEVRQSHAPKKENLSVIGERLTENETDGKLFEKSSTLETHVYKDGQKVVADTHSSHPNKGNSKESMVSSGRDESYQNVKLSGIGPVPDMNLNTPVNRVTEVRSSAIKDVEEQKSCQLCKLF